MLRVTPVVPASNTRYLGSLRSAAQADSYCTPVSLSGWSSGEFDENSSEVGSESFSRREDKDPATTEPTARFIEEGPNFEGLLTLTDERGGAEEDELALNE